MEDLKVVLDRDSANALVTLIESFLEAGAIEDNQKLMQAGLYEVWEKLKPKLVFVAAHYKIKLTPVQGLALRIMHSKAKFEGIHFNNVLLTISNHVHQKFI
jgi:hypothetical protein